MFINKLIQRYLINQYLNVIIPQRVRINMEPIHGLFIHNINFNRDPVQRFAQRRLSTGCWVCSRNRPSSTCLARRDGSSRMNFQLL